MQYYISPAAVKAWLAAAFLVRSADCWGNCTFIGVSDNPFTNHLLITFVLLSHENLSLLCGPDSKGVSWMGYKQLNVQCLEPLGLYLPFMQ